MKFDPPTMVTTPPVSRRSFHRMTVAATIGAAAGTSIGYLGSTSNSSGSEDQKSSTARIDSSKLDKVTEFLEKECDQGSVPGAGIVASHNGKLIYEHFTGRYHSLAGSDQPYQRDVRGLFYSYTKGISATVVMIAHQRGLLDIDRAVANYIPEFAAHGKDRITLRHVLTHSAGIPSAPTPFKPLRNETEWKEAIDAVCQAKLEWEPGSRTAYHGLAMMIPAEVVRRQLKGKAWNDICRELLFDPIGAPTLTFEVPQDQSLVTASPPGSTGQDGMHALVPGHPAGGCFGTLHDAIKVLELHLHGGKWAGDTVLEPKAWEAMHSIEYAKQIEQSLANKSTPGHENWAVGWLMRGNGAPIGGASWFGFRDLTGPKVFGHAGIDTVIGVADPDSGVAMMFHTTRSPKTSEETVRLRNEATNRVFASVIR